MESSWRRAQGDTKRFRRSPKSFWGLEIVGAAVLGFGGSLLGFLLTPIDRSRLVQFLYPAAGGVVGIIVGLVLVFFLIFLWNLFRAPYRQRDEQYLRWNEAREKVVKLEEERIPKVSAEPRGGRRNQEWEHEHLMFAELLVTNTSPVLTLENVEVHVVSSLWILEHEDSYKLYDHKDWTPVGVYWSERDTGIADCLRSFIPPNGTRIALIAFSDDTNGPPAVFNTPTRRRPLLIGGAKKIGIEVSCTNSASWKGEFYIECCPNYLNGPQATIKFVTWETWAANHNVINSSILDGEGSQT